jgi:hypothetical protein
MFDCRNFQTLSKKPTEGFVYLGRVKTRLLVREFHLSDDKPNRSENMKLLFFLFLPLMALAQVQRSMEIHSVRSIDYKDGEATVTFWDDNKVYRLDEKAKVMPCLENGWKAPKEVVIGLDEKGNILNCKLYGGGFPQL